jgi:hypothetical protein
MHKNKKNNYSENKMKELEHLRHMNDTRASSCQNLKRSHNDTRIKPRMQLCIDENGKTLSRKN